MRVWKTKQHKYCSCVVLMHQWYTKCLVMKQHSFIHVHHALTTSPVEMHTGLRYYRVIGTRGLKYRTEPIFWRTGIFAMCIAAIGIADTREIASNGHNFFTIWVRKNYNISMDWQFSSLYNPVAISPWFQKLKTENNSIDCIQKWYMCSSFAIYWKFELGIFNKVAFLL